MWPDKREKASESVGICQCRKSLRCARGAGGDGGGGGSLFRREETVSLNLFSRAPSNVLLATRYSLLIPHSFGGNVKIFGKRAGRRREALGVREVRGGGRRKEWPIERASVSAPQHRR